MHGVIVNGFSVFSGRRCCMHDLELTERGAPDRRRSNEQKRARKRRPLCEARSIREPSVRRATSVTTRSKDVISDVLRYIYMRPDATAT